MPLKLAPDSKWYSKGLRFECTQCGKCCTGAPGYTWINHEEIDQISGFLKITKEEFAKRYLRSVDGKLALLEKMVGLDYDCIFLKDRQCQIYPVRPSQCRTFPWWARNLKSPEDWAAAAQHCEGIRPEAPLISFETIQDQFDPNIA